MENLIAYLDESLIPLERKVKDYLELEKEIKLLDVEVLSLQARARKKAESTDEGELTRKEQLLEEKLQRYQEMQGEIIQMLPEQNKFIEVNLGYGPSMIGYFTVDHETHQKLPEPVLRIVH